MLLQPHNAAVACARQLHGLKALARMEQLRKLSDHVSEVAPMQAQEPRVLLASRSFDEFGLPELRDSRAKMQSRMNTVINKAIVPMLAGPDSPMLLFELLDLVNFTNVSGSCCAERVAQFLLNMRAYN